MRNARRQFFGAALTAVAGALLAGVALTAQDVKITDPTSVVMIVNRDSNDISFMDQKTHKIIGRTFLGNNVNPHMVMMSPDGRYVVTGGTRANKAYIIDTPDAAARQDDRGRPRARASRVLAGRALVLPGEPGRRFGLGHRHAVAEQGQDDSRVRRAAERDLHPGRVEGLHRQLRGALGRGHRRPPARAPEEDPGGRSPRRGRLDPDKYLGEINGVSNASITNDGRYLYAADSDLGLVSVIDTRDDRVVKTIRVGAHRGARS